MTSVSMAPHRSPPLPSTHWPMMVSFLTTTTFSPSVRPQGRHCWLENIRYTWVGILSSERCWLTHWSMSKRLTFCRRHFVLHFVGRNCLYDATFFEVCCYGFNWKVNWFGLTPNRHGIDLVITGYYGLNARRIWSNIFTKDEILVCLSSEPLLSYGRLNITEEGNCSLPSSPRGRAWIKRHK